MSDEVFPYKVGDRVVSKTYHCPGKVRFRPHGVVVRALAGSYLTIRWDHRKPKYKARGRLYSPAFADRNFRLEEEGERARHPFFLRGLSDEAWWQELLDEAGVPGGLELLGMEGLVA